jgi:hypothetical protein
MTLTPLQYGHGSLSKVAPFNSISAAFFLSSSAMGFSYFGI